MLSFSLGPVQNDADYKPTRQRACSTYKVFTSESFSWSAVWLLYN